MHELQLSLTPKEAAVPEILKGIVAKKLNIKESSINHIQVIKKSIDSRGKFPIVLLKVRAFVGTKPNYQYENVFKYENVENKREVIVVGSGPAGLFAALRLIEFGLKPIVLERGKEVLDRKKDIAQLNRNVALNVESNYCFGEGGAGTFSDGKLYTRSKKRGNTQRIFEIFHYHGAQDEILYEAHPHIGTDRLPQVIKNMRQRIIDCGGEIHFNSCVNEFIVEFDAIKGVRCTNGLTYMADNVILATGHSARDIYHLLHRQGIKIEAKGFAMGVRAEHPQALIDSIQYHCRERNPYLPAASYGLVHQVDGRGVYSFCMCPGGYVVNASSEKGRLAVNGMSYHARGGENANSAIIVAVTPEDFPIAGALGGVEFQRQLEEKAFHLGSGNIPVQLYGDFKENKETVGFGDVNPQFCGNHSFANLRELMTEEMNLTFIEGMQEFGRKIKGFDRYDAILAGIESRTSSPLRIVRGENMESNIKGLFPCGEGAGYAGGITSAAMDGLKVAEELIKRYNPC